MLEIFVVVVVLLVEVVVVVIGGGRGVIAAAAVIAGSPNPRFLWRYTSMPLGSVQQAYTCVYYIFRS